jgi:MFS family permease
MLTTHTIAVVMAAMALLGLCIVCFNTGATTLIQHRTPLPLVGRVDAAISLGITILQTLSIALGAALITILSYRTLLLIMTVLISASAVYLGLGLGRSTCTGQHQGTPRCSAQHYQLTQSTGIPPNGFSVIF